jgi:hypothetical protein
MNIIKEYIPAKRTLLVHLAAFALYFYLLIFKSIYLQCVSSEKYLKLYDSLSVAKWMCFKDRLFNWFTILVFGIFIVIVSYLIKTKSCFIKTLIVHTVLISGGVSLFYIFASIAFMSGA